MTTIDHPILSYNEVLTIQSVLKYYYCEHETIGIVYKEIIDFIDDNKITDEMSFSKKIICLILSYFDRYFNDYDYIYNRKKFVPNFSQEELYFKLKFFDRLNEKY